MTADPRVAEALRLGRRNRWSAAKLMWVSANRALDERLEVLAAIGAVDPTDDTRPRRIVPDDDTVIPLGSLGKLGTGPGADDPNALTRKMLEAPPSTRDRSMVPAGLRDLPPSAAVPKPKPVRRPPRKKARPPAPVPVPSPAAAALPRPRLTAAEVRRNGLTAAQVAASRPGGTGTAPEATPASSVTAETKPARKRPGPRTKPREHGTVTGYGQHYKRHDLPTCRACRDAYNAAKERRKETARAREYAEWLAGWMTRRARPGRTADFVADLAADMRATVRDLSSPTGDKQQERSA